MLSFLKIGQNMLLKDIYAFIFSEFLNHVFSFMITHVSRFNFSDSDQNMLLRPNPGSTHKKYIHVLYNDFKKTIDEKLLILLEHVHQSIRISRLPSSKVSCKRRKM